MEENILNLEKVLNGHKQGFDEKNKEGFSEYFSANQLDIMLQKKCPVR